MDKARLVCLVAGLLVLGSVFFPAIALADVSVSPSSLKFGSVTVGSSSDAATLTVSNDSGESVTLDKISCNSSDFRISGPALPVSLGVHKTVSFTVEFHPAAVSAFTASITIVTGSHAASANIPVSGTGIAPLTHLLSPGEASLSFGDLLVGSTASKSLSLTNTGTGSVTVSEVSTTGAGFSVSGFSGSVRLSAGKTLSLTVHFAPAATGAVAGKVSVVSTATNSPATISLSGIGVQPLLSVVPATVSFGDVTVGVTNSQTMTIRNAGTANLSLTEVSASGTCYSLSGLSLPLSIAPGNSAALNISFAPASASSFPGSLNLVSNAPTSPTSIALSGTGIAQVLKLSASPASLNFGSVTVGTSASQSIMTTNTGNSTVTISQIAVSGTGFRMTGVALPVSLAAGQSTSFSVAFASAAVGSFTGSFAVTSNATNSPLVISLSGTTTAQAASVSLTWTPSSSTYAGFNVYRGTASGGPYSKIDPSLISTPAYTDSSVTAGQTYYYVATEVNSSGDESAYSSEVSAVIP